LQGGDRRPKVEVKEREEEEGNQQTQICLLRSEKFNSILGNIKFWETARAYFNLFGMQDRKGR
jgi:hypothetical protein